jgi:S1-C subfamily serine protease|nr:trypsin-like peptidase domain-containing protein [Kofleriaceae bacterium]
MADREPDELRRSVVKLFTVVKEPDFYHPWELSRQHTSGGSACIIDGNRILTNAHVVAHHLHVQALKWGDTKKYAARVLHIDHDTETALLTVDDPRFFEGTTPVTFGPLPPRNAEVFVYGFPVGGNELCTTAGVVSRIEVRTYTHSQRSLLALQTDAAINPGNSGGPVFWNGELVGIAFQSYRRKDLERAGYVVPMPIIQHMLDDLGDGAIAGVPDLGVYWQKIENDALGAHLGLPDGASGVRVSRVLWGSSADGALEVDDVMSAIDDVPIASDGTVPLRDHERVQFTHLVTRRQVGDSVTLDVWRRGERTRVPIALRPYVAMVPPPRPNHRPTFFIFAGLVFTPLSYEYMHNWEWAKDHHRYANFAYETFPSPRRKQVVLIHEVLAHSINIGYHQVRGAVVERVNGVDITDMHDLPRAFAEPHGKFHVIETDYHGPRSESSDYHAAYGTRIVLDAGRTAAATAEILAQNEIGKDRSADLGG